MTQAGTGVSSQRREEKQREMLSHLGDCELQGPMSLVRLMPIFPFTWRKFVRAQNQHRWKQRGERKGKEEMMFALWILVQLSEGQPIVFSDFGADGNNLFLKGFNFCLGQFELGSITCNQAS